jgi:NADH-quinone oxidoreductase subunit C
MAELANSFVLEQINAQFGSDILHQEEPYGMLTLTVSPGIIADLLKWLNNHEDIQAKFLTDICGAHYPDNVGGDLCAIYHVQSMTKNFRIRIKCYVSSAQPEVPSVVSLYSAANWMERETYDFYGIQFMGHPNLKRILNVDEMDYFPLRKQYPLEDGTRVDKIDEYFGR